MPAIISTDKDSIVIRVNDMFNSYKNAGFIKITATKGSLNPQNLSITDSTNTLLFFNDSTQVHGTYLNISKPVTIYVASEKKGKYIMNIKVLDIIGKPSYKSIPVNVIENIRPNAYFNVTQNNTLITIDASASNSKYGQIRTYNYIIDGINNIKTSPIFTKSLAPGLHTISLIVIDDLGIESLITTKYITI